jgi:hypothetical protein
MQVFIPILCVRTRKRFFLRTEVVSAEEVPDQDSSPVEVAAVACPHCASAGRQALALEHAKLKAWCERRFM